MDSKVYIFDSRTLILWVLHQRRAILQRQLILQGKEGVWT